MSTIDEAIANLKKIGYTDKRLEKLLDQLAEEVEEVMFIDLASVSTDEELEAFEKRIKESKSPEEYGKISDEMAKRAYGEKADEKIEEILIDMLEEVEKVTLKIRETYQKYLDKDPDAVKQVEEFKNDPKVKEIMQQFENDGVDFNTALAE